MRGMEEPSFPGPYVLAWPCFSLQGALLSQGAPRPALPVQLPGARAGRGAQ